MGPRDTPELVGALCHEVGNLLASVRLSAHALDADAARRIDVASARAGSLMFLLRCLVDPAAAGAGRCTPGDVLGDLVRACADAGRASRAAPDGVDGLPAVACDRELLHHLLLAAALAADAEPPLRATAVDEGDFVRIELEAPVSGGEALCGAGLAHALAEALLADRGGRIEVRRRGASERVCLRLRVAPG